MRSLSVRRRRALAALAFAALGSVALASSAAAAPAAGGVTLTFKRGADSSLLRQGVKVNGEKGKSQRVKLAVRNLNGSTIKARGALVFRANGSKARLGSINLKAGNKSTAISAKLNGKRKVFFRTEGTPRRDGSSGLALKGGTLRLTGSGAKAIKSQLRLDALPSGQVGNLSLSAWTVSGPTTPVPLPPAPPITPAPPAPPEPPIDPYPFASECPLAAVAGNPGFGNPPQTIEGTLPLPTFGATVQPVTGTALDWGFSTGLRNYVLANGSLQTFDGASASAPGAGMSNPLAYFRFVVADGDYERGTAPDHADDKLVANSTGTVLFCNTKHGFAVAIKDPAIVIDGVSSRIVADVGANMSGTWYPFQRVDLASLDIDGVTPAVTDGGNSIEWPSLPATLTADGAAALGIYEAGDELNPVSVEATLDRPLLAQCGVDAGTVEAPPAVDFTLAALPTLNDPVVRSGQNIGTINWGFRRATRGTVAAPGGLFLPLDGATEGFPGSMGGGASLPPTGGIGKFFRFPIASYEYDAGLSEDVTDDRLIATSNATVGLCKPKTSSGNYAVVLSKPTLIIDGANSRVVANAYSFAGPFGGGGAAGWTGGRVDLVALDPSGVEVTSGVSTRRWGDVQPDWEPIQNGIPVAGGMLTNALSIASGLGKDQGTGGFDLVAAQIVLPAP